MPDILRNAGSANKLKVTDALTGFPGKANTRQFDCGSCAGSKGSLAVWATVTNVVGFPGFILTLPKCVVELNLVFNTFFSKSVSPIETPPVVITTLQLPMACKRACSSFSELKIKQLSYLSGTIPKSTTSKPAAKTALFKLGRFASYVFPGFRGQFSTTSFPVLRIPTFGLP